MSTNSRLIVVRCCFFNFFFASSTWHHVLCLLGSLLRHRKQKTDSRSNKKKATKTHSGEETKKKKHKTRVKGLRNINICIQFDHYFGFVYFFFFVVHSLSLSLLLALFWFDLLCGNRMLWDFFSGRCDTLDRRSISLRLRERKNKILLGKVDFTGESRRVEFTFVMIALHSKYIHLFDAYEIRVGDDIMSRFSFLIHYYIVWMGWGCFWFHLGCLILSVYENYSHFESSLCQLFAQSEWDFVFVFFFCLLLVICGWCSMKLVFDHHYYTIFEYEIVFLLIHNNTIEMRFPSKKFIILCTRLWIYIWQIHP